jgi:hypothetical protein
MKNIIIILILLTTFVSITKAQDSSPILNGDTAIYAGHKFYKNQEVKLLYGAKPNKDFAFVSSEGINNQVLASYCNLVMIVNEIKKQNGKYYVYGNFKAISGFWPNKSCIIDIQAAVDFKEIKVD